MMKFTKCLGFTKSVVATVFLFTLHSTLHSAQAASPADSKVTIKVRVEAKPPPTRAVGMIISTTGASQIAETSLQKVGDKLYDIVFEVERSSLSADSVATAMAISEGGDITFANVTPTLLSDSRDAVANIPECASEDTTQIATINQLAPLKSLVDIRRDRADLAQRKVLRALGDETLSKLKRFEEAFGLGGIDELSINLPPHELVDRLARINYAVKQYQSFKKQTSSASHKNGATLPRQ